MTRLLRTMAIGLILTALSLHAQFNTSGNVALKDFSMSGFGEDGTGWILEGRGCVANGLVVNISDFKLSFSLKQNNAQTGPQIIRTDENGRVTVTLSSSNCTFNTTLKEIKGDSSVHITIGKNVAITGIGYDVDINHKVILLRSAVNMTMQTSKKLYKTPSASTLSSHK